MNPFPTFRDSLNVSSGNPDLLPEYTHSIELGCKLQNDEFSILPSIYYRYTYNRFTSITEQIENVLYTTRTNLANDQSTGVETIVSASLSDVFTAHASANVFYNQIDASNLGYSTNKSTVSWSGAMTLNLNLMQNSMLQVNSSYSSRRLTPQGEYLPSYVVNFGLRQELMDKQLSLIFTVADLFKSLQRKGNIDTPLLKQSTANYRDSRVVYIGFTYHFGTPTKKSEDDLLKYDN
jgi:outer membrane receptor protein involved in Fe transport